LTKLENLTIYSHTYPNSHLELTVTWCRRSV